MKFLYSSYDREGFQAALDYGLDFNESESIERQHEILCHCGNLDLNAGHCTSFQIYNDSGEIVFNSETQKAAKMDKRQMLHVLIDKLLDIEETSKKGIHFSYSTLLSFSSYATVTPGNYTHRVGPNLSVYLKPEWDQLEQFDAALKVIEDMGNTPDEEPKIKVELTELKARELGLIA